MSVSRKNTVIEVGTSEEIAIVAMPTHNDSLLLRRGLESYIENSIAYNRDVSFVVADDTKHSQAATNNIHELKRLKERYFSKIVYIGRQQKVDFIQHLESHGIAKDVLTFMLFGPAGAGRTTGANRNALLLHALDSAYLSVDDDTICELVQPTTVLSRVRVTDGDPTEMWFPREGSNTMAAVETDVLSLHERWIGTRIENAPEYLDRRQLDTRENEPRCHVSAIKPDSTIEATWMGLFGDVGTPHFPSVAMQQVGNTRHRLMSSESEYRRILTTRNALRCSPQHTLTDPHGWMTTVTAYENRKGHPPFLPAGRGQDSLFGALLALSAPSAMVAYLPYAVSHKPRRPRTKPLQLAELRVHLFHVVLFLLDEIEVPVTAIDRLTSLASIGRAITSRLKRMKLADFHRFVYRNGARRCEQQIAYCEYLLDEYDCSPGYWAEDIRRYVNLRREALQQEEFAIPIETQSVGLSGLAALEFSKDIATRYGELLIVWPSVLKAVRELKNDGVSIGQLI